MRLAQHSVEKRSLTLENIRLRREIEREFGLDQLVSSLQARASLPPPGSSAASSRMLTASSPAPRSTTTSRCSS
jgi:hypothetical protein